MQLAGWRVGGRAGWVAGWLAGELCLLVNLQVVLVEVWVHGWVGGSVWSVGKVLLPQLRIVTLSCLQLCWPCSCHAKHPGMCMPRAVLVQQMSCQPSWYGYHGM